MKCKKNYKNKRMLSIKLCEQLRLKKTFSISKEMIYKTAVGIFFLNKRRVGKHQVLKGKKMNNIPALKIKI